MLEKYLTIFRSMNNFVFVGDDGKTPAMRLGFARRQAWTVVLATKGDCTASAW